MKSEARHAGLQPKGKAKLLTVIGLTNMHAICCITFMLYQIWSRHMGKRMWPLSQSFSYKLWLWIIVLYSAWLLLQQGISEPEFYGDLVYRFRQFVGKSNFSDQF